MWRRLLIGLAVLLIVLAGGVTAYQQIAGARLRDGLGKWAAARRAEGWQVSYGRPEVAGWPRAAILVVPDFRLAVAGPAAPAWRAKRLRVVLRLAHPDHVEILADGPQHVGVAGQPEQAFTAGLLRLVIPFRPAAGQPVATLVADRVAAADTNLGIAALRLDLTGLRPAEIGFDLAAQGIDLPAGSNWPLGAHIGAVAAQGVLEGGIPPPEGITAAARAWRDAGGRLKLAHGALHWGPLDATLQAEARLDAALQPEATGTAELSGYAKALDVMAARHVLTNDAALAAKAVLSLVAQTPPRGGPARVRASFSVKGGVLSVGPIPILRLQPIAWPGE